MNAAALLEGHPWVALARADAGGTGVAVAPSHAGAALLRRQGRRALLDELAAHLAEHGAPAPRDWRLLDGVPAALPPAAVEALLRAPRPAQATLLYEQAHDDGSWTLALRLPLDLVHFDGHFPRAPVLPGVLQVGWALALAAPRLGTPPHCREMEALKFQRLLRPGDEVELFLRHDAARGKLHFAYRLDGEHCSSGRLLAGRADG